ncbi:hypothetical protein ACP4OV_010275 [Aristida adscensionis]
MSGLSGAPAAARWWEEWQMRVLVLTSLGIQFLMWFIACMRKFNAPLWFRLIVQMLSVARDAMVVYALATLFKRQENSSAAHGGSRDLEVLWAPILLMHFGGYGVSTISSIQTEDQWQRIILTTVSKVVVALFVFYKSWSSNDKRLLAALILLFIAAIRKGAQHSLSLKLSSFHSIQASSSISVPTLDLESFVSRVVCRYEFDIDPPTEIRVGPHEVSSVSEMEWMVWCLPLSLCLDFVTSSVDRLACMHTFLGVRNDTQKSCQLIEDGLSQIFDAFYTKDTDISKIYKLWPSIPIARISKMLSLVVVIVNGPLIPAIALFHLISHKQAYRGADIMVTFVLLYGTLLLANSLLFTVATLKWRWQWSTKVAQLSLLGVFIHNRRYTILIAIASFIGLKDFLSRYWVWVLPASCNSCFEITTLVRQHVIDGWLHHIKDAETYQRFTDTTGELVFQREGCEQLLDLERRTRWCYIPNLDSAKRSREMSNYMLYLLLANPEMLAVGSRNSLLADACDELRQLFEGTIGKAWKLTQCLRGLNDQSKMWRVIQGVWLEMLCFSAARCRGYLHAESLGSGGEYLSYVWLVLGYAGLETFPDKLQKRHHLPLSGFTRA